MSIQIRFQAPAQDRKPKVSAGKRTNSLGAEHPVNNEKNNNELISHINHRMHFAKAVHDTLIARFESIDKLIAGYVRLTDEAKDAKKKTEDGDPTPSKMNLQLVMAQLDEEVTYLMSVFAPDTSMYEAIARKDQQPAANAFALLMNQNSKTMKYYREYAKALFSCLKYNLGGVEIKWKKIIGTKVSFTSDGQFEAAKNEIVWEGNEVTSLDMYNTYWDVSQHPVDVPLKGEFVAQASMHTIWELARMQENEEIFNAHDIIEQGTVHEIQYYVSPPEVQPTAFGSTNENSRSNTDWVNVLTAGVQTANSLEGVERVDYTGWIIPKDFGLSKSEEYQIWRVTFINSEQVVAATQLTNVHGQLPFAFGSPVEDNLGLQQKSLAESLAPLQEFGSFMINSHMTSYRKRTWGITVYDPHVIPLQDVGTEVSARVPVNPAGYGKDLRNSLQNINDAPDTGGTMSDLAQVIDLMQVILPTDTQRQVAGLERATQYHAAATVQGGNKRSLKIAKIINDQMFTGLRQQQLYNIMQFQPTIQLSGPDGEPVDISPSTFQTLDMEFLIEEGLKSLDKLSAILYLKDIINSVLQSQQAMKEIDIVMLLNYFTQLMGDQTDLNQFRKTPAQQTSDTTEETAEEQPQ